MDERFRKGWNMTESEIMTIAYHKGIEARSLPLNGVADFLDTEKRKLCHNRIESEAWEIGLSHQGNRANELLDAWIRGYCDGFEDGKKKEEYASASSAIREIRPKTLSRCTKRKAYRGKATCNLK